MAITTLRGRKGLVQALLGVEILALLFVLTLITCSVLAAELLKRDTLSNSTPPSKRGGYPTLVFDEVSGYTFTKGKADLTDKFKRKLISRVPEIIRKARRYGADRIEVVGHTDEEPMRAGFTSNLDSQLVPTILGYPAKELVVTDNVGLGMIRAISVSTFLRSQRELSHLTIVPLSGGQMILTNGALTGGSGGEAPRRRRIELRLLKLQYAAKPAKPR